MSIGNLKTDGGKGTNWPWQYKMLLGLDKIAKSFEDATEFEAQLVRIDCSGNPSPPPSASDIIRLEVRVWDIDRGLVGRLNYYEPGSITPDSTDYSGCIVTYMESGDATEATLQAILAKNTEIEVTADAILAMNTDIEAKTTLVVANTDSIKADIQDILVDTDAIETNTDSLVDVTNTPTMLRATAAGQVTIAAIVKSISFYNASATDTAHVLTVDLKPGETVNFDAGGNGNKFPASTFTYDADTTGGGAGDLLIIYVV